MKALVFKLLALFILVSVAQSQELKVIKFSEAKKLFENKEALFLDARGEKLYKRGTILGSLNLPVNRFQKSIAFLPNDKDANLVSFCNGIKCEKSDELAILLQKAGYTNVLVYKGGYPEWKEKSMPLMALKTEITEPKVKESKGQKYQAKGTTIYLGEDKGMVDQFWFEKVVLNELPKNVQLVDIRKAKDFKEGHIKGAINATWDSKTETINLSKISDDKLIVLYCNTGMQSAEAALSLKDRVGKDVFYFDANVACEKNNCKVEANENL